MTSTAEIAARVASEQAKEMTKLRAALKEIYDGVDDEEGWHPLDGINAYFVAADALGLPYHEDSD